MTSDSTIEQLTILMQGSHGMTILRDELSGFLMNLDRYAGGGSDRQFYLSAYSGEIYHVDRVSREPISIQNTYLTIIGGIQPSVAQAIFAAREGVEDGLFERFACMAYPSDIREWQPGDEAVDEPARQAYEGMCRTLLNTQWPSTLQAGDVENQPSHCAFDKEAQAIFNAWYERHMRALRTMGDDPMVGFMGKAQGFLGRICLTLHLARWASRLGGWGEPGWIDRHSIEDAVALVDHFFVPTWRRVTSTFSRGAEESKARKIARLILAKPNAFREKGIRARDIIVHTHRVEGMRTADEVLPALRVLCDRGWLDERFLPSKAQGGRPATVFAVNPRVFR